MGFSNFLVPREGLLGTEELRAKLAQLKEQRDAVEKELAACRNRCEYIEELDVTASILFWDYFYKAPVIMADWIPEQQHELYQRLRICVTALPDGGIDISGAFVCTKETTSRTGMR